MKYIFIILVLINFVGCTFNKPTGPSFVPYSLKDKNKALIYIYRPVGESHGYNRTYYLYNNGKKIVDLKHGGYFPLVVVLDSDAKVIGNLGYKKVSPKQYIELINSL